MYNEKMRRNLNTSFQVENTPNILRQCSVKALFGLIGIWFQRFQP